MILFDINNIPSKRLNSSIRLIDGTIIGTMTPDQSGPESNDNEVGT